MDRKETDMTPIPTWYKDHRYPAKQQARQAVLMDEAGWSFEIEPSDPKAENENGAFQVGQRLQMRPDFLLHNAWCAPVDGQMFYLDKVYVEPKGKWNDEVAEQVDGFWNRCCKNILLVDKILWWPLLSDHYDESWDKGRSFIEIVYDGMSSDIRSKKEKKALSGYGKWHDYQFSLSMYPPCIMCGCECPNVSCTPERSSHGDMGCLPNGRRFSDMALCVGSDGQPVIYQFSPLEDECERDAVIERFSFICNPEATCAIYRAAAEADNNGLFTYDEDHPEYLARRSAMHRSPVSMRQQYALDM